MSCHRRLPAPCPGAQGGHRTWLPVVAGAPRAAPARMSRADAARPQARASRLSFADIVRRLAALPKEHCAFVSAKARRTITQ